MTTRDRILTVFRGGRPDRLPNVEFGYWNETIHRWHTEGLPHDAGADAAVEHHLNLEGITIFSVLPCVNGLYPRFERRVIEEHKDRVIVHDEEGNICEELAGQSSMPRYIHFGLQTQDDWERLKYERLDPDTPGRIGDLQRTVSAARISGKPCVFDAGSLYGWLRNWMGVEGLSYALMTERPWVERMMDHLTFLTLTLCERVLSVAPVDIAWWWEDMCYNRGPLLSPTMFREMMVPRYKQITQFLKSRGVEFNVLDCDGRIHEVVPGWLESGITCMFPLEAAHTDAFRLRKDYGDRILLIGGVDKRALIAGREAIDKEIDRLVPLVHHGRFIPCVDHRVPADVTFANYLYYLEKKEVLLRI